MVSVNIASPGAEAYEMAECGVCGVIDPQEDIAIHEGGHNIQNEVCEECFRVAPIEAQGVTGRWVPVPSLHSDDDLDYWLEAVCPPDRLVLGQDDIVARDFEWEWVPYEPDQVPVLFEDESGNECVSWR